MMQRSGIWLSAALLLVGGCTAAERAPDPVDSAQQKAETVVAQKLTSIRIEGFECGDNCYLDYSMIARSATKHGKGGCGQTRWTSIT